LTGVDAFRVLSEQDDTDEARRIIRSVPTDDLLKVERLCVRLVWIARDVRQEREVAGR
jgi:hypothetical protein